MKRIALLFLIFAAQPTNAQTEARWAQIVNWDGFSPWQKYINFAPAFMGPNAIPVPSLATGGIDSVSYIGIGLPLHFGSGDNTQALEFSGNYCLVKDLVAIDLSYIPVEWFQESDATKDKRHVYWPYYNSRSAQGDVNMNIRFRLLKKWDRKVKLGLRVGYRFPSSNAKEVAMARYTDAPGYFFDVSAGRYLSDRHEWMISGMAGFYVWQLTDFGQNDAFLFGGGLSYAKNGWRAQVALRGYTGWKQNGDFPILVSGSLEKLRKKMGWSLQLQRGLHDFGYTSVSFGTKWLLRSP